MSAPKARVKKGNIALFVVLIGIGAYVFNKESIDQKLIDVGLLEEKTAEESTEKTLKEAVDEKTADFEAEKEKLEAEEKKQETKVEKKPQANIEMQADVFFLNEENPIQVSVDGLEGKDFSILLEGRNKVVEIETIDKNSGKYNVKALKKGNISLSVMGKVNKKIDLIKTQDFEVLSRADYTKRKQSNQQTQTSSGGLSYDLPNANILYVGIDNELIINAKNINFNSFQLKATNAKVTKSSGKFLINPNNKGNVSIQVFEGSNKLEQRNFAARNLPTPLPTISGRSGGTISAAVLQRASRLDLLTDYKDLPNMATPTLMSYEIIRYSPMSSSTGKAKNTGANFSADVRRLVSQAKVNDLFYFTNIAAKMPNGKTIELPSIAFDVE